MKQNAFKPSDIRVEDQRPTKWDKLLMSMQEFGSRMNPMQSPEIDEKLLNNDIYLEEMRRHKVNKEARDYEKKVGYPGPPKKARVTPGASPDDEFLFNFGIIK